MKKRTMNKEGVLKYLLEYLTMALDELTETKEEDGFINGEITAYVECLEILNFYSGFDGYEISKIAKKYQI